MDSDLKLLGHQELDRQHLSLARATDSFSKSQSQLDMTIALNDFFETWRGHTAFEEELMRHSDFPALNEHKENHRLITREITHLFKMSISVGFQSRELISRMLRYWFDDHLLVYDTPFVEHLARQQLLIPSQACDSPDDDRLSASGSQVPTILRLGSSTHTDRCEGRDAGG